MHELTAAKQIVNMIIAESSNLKKVSRVAVDLGILTTYKKEPLCHYFNAIKKENTKIENCILDVRVIPGKIKCADCNTESAVWDPCIILCQKCDSANINVVDGKDLIVKKIIGE